jgi:hypothetical protein
MKNFLVDVIDRLNSVANALGNALLPIGYVPAWLSVTVVAILTGIVMLLIFKYTSNQRAIKNVRKSIKSSLLALRLFKDNVSVVLQSQGRVLVGAFRLLVLAIVPVIVMIVPMSLLLSQLGLWYQNRPLEVGSEATVTLKLNGPSDLPMTEVQMRTPVDATGAPAGIKDLTGPVRIFSRREVCWSVEPIQNGYHTLVFVVDGNEYKKEVAVGPPDEIMQVSVERPEWNWLRVFFNPLEVPFHTDSPVKSIEVEFPQSSSWTCGADNWVIYLFVVSLVAAFALRRVFNVNF